MKILSSVVAAVLALSLAAPTSWAGSSAASPANGKAPAHSSANDKTKSNAAKPGSKKGEVNLGSAWRQEILKNKLQAQSKSAKGKTGAPKKTVQKKS